MDRKRPAGAGELDEGPGLGSLKDVRDLGLQDEPELGVVRAVTPSPPPVRRAGPGPLIAIAAGVGVLGLLVVVPVGYLGLRALLGGPESAGALVEVPAEVLDEPEAPVEELAEGEAPAEARPEPPAPAPAPAPAADPQPPAAPRPAPAPKAQPAAPTAASLSASGWKLASSDPDQAAARFREALALTPGHADAEYGLGYVLLQQGASDQALPHLCRAMGAGGAIQRDVRSILSRNGLSCDG